jgi:hypothetical protein
MIAPAFLLGLAVVAGEYLLVSSPAKAGDPVRRGFSALY